MEPDPEGDFDRDEAGELTAFVLLNFGVSEKETPGFAVLRLRYARIEAEIQDPHAPALQLLMDYPKLCDLRDRLELAAKWMQPPTSPTPH